MRPSWVWADNTTWSNVEGYTCPWASTSFSQMAMASGNDPVASSSAARRRLPRAWSRATAKRYLSARTSGSAGSFAKATRHLRMSPGGVTSASSRKTPVLPPSSAMATTALVCTPKESSVRMETGAPVPPPMTTAFSARASSSKGRRFGSALRRAENAAVAAGSTRKASVLFFMPATFYASFPPPARASSTSRAFSRKCSSVARRPAARTWGFFFRRRSSSRAKA